MQIADFINLGIMLATWGSVAVTWYFYRMLVRNDLAREERVKQEIEVGKIKIILRPFLKDKSLLIGTVHTISNKFSTERIKHAYTELILEVLATERENVRFMHHDELMDAVGKLSMMDLAGFTGELKARYGMQEPVG